MDSDLLKSPSRNKNSFLNCSKQIVNSDFLSPAVGHLLFPDLFHALIPLRIGQYDRAGALELSWEKPDGVLATDAFCNTVSLKMAEGLRDLYRRGIQNRAWLPIVLFNSTLVETGNRLIISNATLQSGDFKNAYFLFGSNSGKIIKHADCNGAVPEYSDCYLSEIIDLRLSTSVHLSARFPGVSPPGSIHVHIPSLLSRQKPAAFDQTRIWARAVDGGYFENSGGTTAYELIDAITRAFEQLKRTSHRFTSVNLKPIVVSIKNDTDPSMKTGRDSAPGIGVPALSTDDKGRFKQAQISKPFTNLTGPILTFMNTRAARGAWIRAVLSQTGECGFVEFSLADVFGKGKTEHGNERSDYPQTQSTNRDPNISEWKPTLGWFLMKLSRETMENAFGDPSLEPARSRIRDVLEGKCSG